jgi:hypothetical protein
MNLLDGGRDHVRTISELVEWAIEIARDHRDVVKPL